MALAAERRVEPTPLDVERIKKDFPILERDIRGKRLVYLDSAATSQKPRQVLDALRDYYERHNANVHRSPHLLGEEATQMYEDARARAARFVGAPDASTIVFNRGTTESLNLVAHGWARKFLREGDQILISELEHRSNIVPWQLAAQATGATLRYIPLTDDGLLDLSELSNVLTERTKLVSISGMSNVLGTIPPVRALADAAHAAGALLCVDGAQLVAHAPVDVAELDCDFLAFSGHKMLGPMASGGLYARRELLEDMDPFLGGGEMIKRVTYESSTYADLPNKYEAGTPNIAVAWKRSPSYVHKTPCAPLHSRVAFSSRASNTGARSPGDELMTCSTSAVAVCWSRASRVSLINRALSIAMTACAAKFCNSAICFGENGRTSWRKRVITPRTAASLRSGT